MAKNGYSVEGLVIAKLKDTVIKMAPNLTSVYSYREFLTKVQKG